MACFCESQRVQRRKAELTCALSGKSTKRIGRLAPNLAHIHMGMDIRQTNCPSRHKGGTWGVLGGQQFKSLGKRSDWHHLWFTYADSSENGHRLNTSSPSMRQGVFVGVVLGCHKSKSLGKLSNGWTDWHQMWHTSAYPSGNGYIYMPNKLPLET